MTGVLYIVSTPIGNLEDITLRAIKTLSEVDIVLAEDTRVTKKLLDFYKLTAARVISYHQYSGEIKRLETLNYLLDGKNISLVVDAGTPGVSDPGNELIGYLLSYIPDLKIVPVPGASALTSALSVCGFDVSRFVFLGFLPKKHRNKLFDWLKDAKLPFAFYESPFRILKTLEMLERVFGGYLRIFVAREITKLHETLYRGRIGKVREELEKERVRGEIVVVVEL